MKDWSKPQRQSFAVVLVQIFRTIRGISGATIPALAGVILAKKDKLSRSLLLLAVILAILFLIGLIGSILKYLYFRFHVKDGELIIRKNIIARKTIHIPLDRIQSVHLEQKFWNTVTGTTRLIVDTPGTDQAEVAIDALTLADARELKSLLLTSNQEQPTLIEEAFTPAVQTISTSFPELIKFSLTANHLKTLGLITGFLLARLEDANQLFQDQAWDWLQTTGENADLGWKTITAIVIFALFISVIISIISTALRYFDLSIQLKNESLNAKWGLIQIAQVSVPRRKIQMMEWGSNFLRKQLGIFLVKMRETTGDIEKLKESKKMELKFPLFNNVELKTLLNCYQEELPADHSPAFKIHISYAIRQIVLFGLPLLFLSVISYQWIQGYAVLPVLAISYYIISTLIYRKKFRFWVSDKGLQVFRGVWGENFKMINWEKIQFVTLSRSYYQRRKGLASLKLLTAGGEITIPYIKKEEAEFLLNYSLFKLESENKNWM